MKSKKIGLISRNPSNVYNKDNTYIGGAVTQKTLPAPYNTSPVLGAPLTKFIDVFTDTLGTFLPGMMFLSDSRLYVLMSAPTASVTNNIILYNFNTTTGAYSYVGKIAFAISSAAPTVRTFKVDDSNVNNIKIFIGITTTSVTLGGVMMINRVQVSNFVPIGFPTFYTAQVDDTAGVYMLHAPREIGGAHLLTQIAGMVVPGQSSPTPAINTKLYAHNGISATHQYYVFDYSVAPTMASVGSTSTVTAANTTGAATTFTMAGHTLQIGDQVIIRSNAPTGFTASAVNGAQTVYFVIASNFVAGSTFSLSATAGGTLVQASTAVGTTVFARALGITTGQFVAKTANLPSLGAGTLLQTNSENYCVPSSGPLSGQECVFLATTTNFFLGKLSEFYTQQTGVTTNASASVSGLSSTSGLTIGQTVFGNGIGAGVTIASIVDATTITLSSNATVSSSQTLTFGAILWPSLSNVNVNGTGLDYVVPVPLQAFYGTTIDAVAMLVSGSVMMTKKFVNSMMASNFANSGNALMEAQNHITDTMKLSAVNTIENGNGWLLSSSATVGQRGIIAMHMRSDAIYDYSMIITPVESTPGKMKLKGVETVEPLFDFTSSLSFYYRTSAAKTDSVFSSVSGGWIEIGTAEDLEIELNNYTQFKMLFAMSAQPGNANISVTTPPQVEDFKYDYESVNEVSESWEFSFKDSSDDIPTKSGFVLRFPYASSVPKLYFRAHDENGDLIAEANTVDDASQFVYSTDDGLTWNPLGTIPNTEGTRIQRIWTTPPGVDARVSLREE